MIELRNISLSFRDSTVLKGFSLHVTDGNVCALLGLSGSGKTTALKLICGLYQPDSGEVLVQGIPLDKSHLREVREQIGYVIQDGGLFPHMTAAQNLRLLGREADWDDQRIQRRIEELSILAQLQPDLLQKYPRQLSGGQRQRIGLMRALFKDPPILLMDEPLGALDPITRRELQQDLRNLFRRLKKTVVLVTHDLFEAGYLADYIFLLNQGQIVQQGTMRDLVERPADDFVRRFVKSQSSTEQE